MEKYVIRLYRWNLGEAVDKEFCPICSQKVFRKETENIFSPYMSSLIGKAVISALLWTGKRKARLRKWSTEYLQTANQEKDHNLRHTDDTTLRAESEELKSFLMKVKEESENPGLKLNNMEITYLYRNVDIFTGYYDSI